MKRTIDLWIILAQRLAEIERHIINETGNEDLVIEMNSATCDIIKGAMDIQWYYIKDPNISKKVEGKLYGHPIEINNDLKLLQIVVKEREYE